MNIMGTQSRKLVKISLLPILTIHDTFVKWFHLVFFFNYSLGLFQFILLLILELNLVSPILQRRNKLSVWTQKTKA